MTLTSVETEDRVEGLVFYSTKGLSTGERARNSACASRDRWLLHLVSH